MSLDTIINPEIYNDEAYRCIVDTLRKDPTIHTIVEIGASSGMGSTEALLEGIQGRSNATVYSIEVSCGRFERLKKRNRPHHVCLHGSTCRIDEFPSDEEVLNTCTRLGITTRLEWKRNDILYLEQHPDLDMNILAHTPPVLDFVLIDGSEFLGYKELQKVYGARYIALDDMNVYKNIESHQQLLADDAYECIANVPLRNGFSMFRRKDALRVV